MDVTKKIELMRVMESYWTMLPPEIHEFILLLKKNQEIFEEERKMNLKAVGQEIVMYNELKEKWALGHVRCVVKRTEILFRPRIKMSIPSMYIYGHHVDLEGVKRKKFLGFSFESALQRVNHVKSFL